LLFLREQRIAGLSFLEKMNLREKEKVQKKTKWKILVVYA